MTKAVVLAAGQGARLRPLTNSCPKCMVSYQGIPIVERLCATLRASEIAEIVLVTGYRSEALDYLGLRMFHNSEFATTNMVHSLFCAEEALTEETVVSYSDIIYSSSILQALLDSTADFSVVVDLRWRELWEARMEDPLLDAETMKISADGSIKELGKKPNTIDEIQGQYIGLFKVTEEAIKEVRMFYHSLDRNRLYDGKPFSQMYMTTFIQLVIDHLMPVKAVTVSGGWLEIDGPSDLECRPVVAD